MTETNFKYIPNRLIENLESDVSLYGEELILLEIAFQLKRVADKLEKIENKEKEN